MTAHVHAASMAEYAKDAMETDKPWERWEWKPKNDFTWRSFVEPSAITFPGPAWWSDTEYRRKPVKSYLYGNFTLSGPVGEPRTLATTRYSDQREVSSNIEYEFLDGKLVGVRLL